MKQGRWIAICVSMFALLALANVFLVNRDAWFDESFTASTVRLMRDGDLGIAGFSQMDVHPPGSYLLQYRWSYLNPGIALHVWLRLLSVIAGAIFITFVGLFAFEVFSDKQAVARSLLLLSIGTTLLQYATEARMYIFVMVLAAFACYAGVMAAKKVSWRWMFAGSVALFALPFFHYFAAGVVPFVLLIWAIAHRNAGFEMAWWYPTVFGGCFAVIGAILSAVVFAMPQMSRIGGFLMQTPTWMSLISGWFFGFQYMGDQITNVFTAVSLMVAVVIALWWAASRLLNVKLKDVPEKLKDREWSISVAMIATAIVVPAGIIWGFFMSYHHRYVLVELWMLVFVTYYVLLSRSKWKDGLYAALLAISIVFVAFWMRAALPEYRATAPETAFQTMAAHIPCNMNITVVHETTFSYIPATQYAWERNCSIRQVLASQMERKWALGAGLDILLLRNDTFWTDGTFNASAGKYLYVNVLNDTLEVQNRSCVMWVGGGKLDERGEIDWVSDEVNYGGRSCHEFTGETLV